MPWTLKQVEEKIKGLSDKQKRAWVKIANSALADCLDGGGSQDRCEASAIRQANAAAKEVSESGEMPDYDAWLSEQSEEAQELIEAHIQGLKSALRKERDARREVEDKLRKQEAKANQMLGDELELIEGVNLGILLQIDER